MSCKLRFYVLNRSVSCDSVCLCVCVSGLSQCLRVCEYQCVWVSFCECVCLCFMPVWVEYQVTIRLGTDFDSDIVPRRNRESERRLPTDKLTLPTAVTTRQKFICLWDSVTWEDMGILPGWHTRFFGVSTTIISTASLWFDLRYAFKSVKK